jgi:hypothetical protein
LAVARTGAHRPCCRPDDNQGRRGGAIGCPVAEAARLAALAELLAAAAAGGVGRMPDRIDLDRGY